MFGDNDTCPVRVSARAQEMAGEREGMTDKNGTQHSLTRERPIGTGKW